MSDEYKKVYVKKNFKKRRYFKQTFSLKPYNSCAQINTDTAE